MVNTMCSWFKKERKERLCVVLQQPLITVRKGCPPPLRAALLAVRAERARLNFPFILGPAGRARRRRSFPRGLSRTRAARPNRKARPRADCGRARSLPPALRVAVASVGACHSGPAARCTGSWRTLSRRSLGCAWREAAPKL